MRRIDERTVDVEQQWVDIVQRDRSHESVLHTWVVRAFADTVGCMLAGAEDEAVRGAWGGVAASGVTGGPATAVVGSHRLPSPFAALVNGTAAHALDFDDVLQVASSHPSAVLVPAILAVAEQEGLGGRDAVDAFLAGLEVLTDLGARVNPSHYVRGWHATSSLGVFGAAAACARLLRLDADGIRHALSLASSMAAGLKRQFGYMSKPLHAGLAAHAGVMAANLARAGTTAAPSIMEGPGGFIVNYSDGLDPDPDRATWPLPNLGLWVKAFPSCASTHRSVQGALELRDKAGARLDAVENMVVEISDFAARSLPYSAPISAREAKFSLNYCVASAFIDGFLDLSSFEEDAVHRPQVRSLMAKIQPLVYETHGPRRGPERTTLTLRLTDGSERSVQIDEPIGDVTRPLSEAQLRRKFVSCALSRLTESDANDLFDAWLGLASIPDVHELVATLAHSCKR